jgi:Tol biopolymer transport system component
MRGAPGAVIVASMHQRLLAGAVAIAAACAGTTTAAHADSIAYIKDNDVWLMAPDGSHQHRVTRDGTQTEPYVSPSQDDRGRIAVGKGYAIRVLAQNGTKLAQFVPRNLKDTVGHSTSGAPAELAISPDGKRIAYALTSVGCDPTIDCGVRATIGIVSSDGKGTTTQPGEYGGINPTWVTNGRLLWNGGYGSQNRVFDLGGAGGNESWNWFDDHEIHTGPLESTDLSDPTVSGDGRYVAAIRGYAETTHVIWYRVNGSILAGANPGAPTELCETNADEQANDPTLSPDGSGLAFGDVDGIQVKRNLDDCNDIALVAARGSQPDWGPANVAPQPVKKKVKKKRG